MNWIRAIIYVVLVGIIGILTVGFVLTQKQTKVQLDRIEQQDKIIDSLLARRMHVVDIHMQVTDKSKNNIYGRYNKGTITIPTQKTYTLDIDSLNIK